MNNKEKKLGVLERISQVFDWRSFFKRIRAKRDRQDGSETSFKDRVKISEVKGIKVGSYVFFNDRVYKVTHLDKEHAVLEKGAERKRESIDSLRIATNDDFIDQGEKNFPNEIYSLVNYKVDADAETDKSDSSKKSYKD